MKYNISLAGVVVLSVLAASLFFSVPAYSKTDNPKVASAASGAVIPVSAGSSLQAASILVTQPAAPAVTISKTKNGVRYYSDGRIAEVKDGSSLATYSYQDETNSYTVYRSDSKEKTYSIDQYVNGILRSSMDSDGNYTAFYDDGKVRQRIVREGLNVFSYDYSYVSTYEIDKEGTWHHITALEAVNVYLSTPKGFEPYSTTTYTKEDLNVDTPTIATTTYYMDPIAVSTDTGKAKPVNFKKMQRAVLKSVKDPYEERRIKTNDKNTYTLKDGMCMTIQFGKNGPTYNFVNGVLMSIYQGSNLVITRTDEGFVRV